MALYEEKELNNKYILEFEKYLIKEKKVSTNTLESYLRDVRQFNEFCLKANIGDIGNASNTHAISFLIGLQKKGRATSTITRNLVALRIFFHYLYDCGLIESNPVINLKAPKVEKKFPKTLTIKEIEILLATPDLNTNKGLRDRAILELLYSTGLKVSELISLEINNINFQEESLYYYSNDEERSIPIGDIAISYLKKYLSYSREKILNDKKCNILFVNMQGSPLTRQGVWKIIKSYTKEAKIKKDITPHMIRHSFALHLLQNGADLHIVKELLGHLDISSTQIYIRDIDQNIKETYKEFHPRA